MGLHRYADTGEIVWYYQHLNDHWDLDHPFERILVDTAVTPRALSTDDVWKPASRRRRHLVACGTGTALICLSTVSTGCAYMMHGSRQRVAVSSTPRGARVLIDDQQVGVTPVQLDLKRHRWR